MNQSEHTFFEDEDNGMQGVDIAGLVRNRLIDLADQIEHLVSQNLLEDAFVLACEGMELAECYDNGIAFFYMKDFTGVQ